MRYLRTFLEDAEWWRFVPDIGETTFFTPDDGVLCARASIGDSRYVLYFYSSGLLTGKLRRTGPALPLKVRWFNPRTGEEEPWTPLPPVRDGAVRLPAKPDALDWALRCEVDE